jgi:hypothetical protein
MRCQQWSSFMRPSILAVIPALLLAGCAHTNAQATRPADISAPDPPSRVARLSYISGAVLFKAAVETD